MHDPPPIPQAEASLPARQRERPPSLLQQPPGHELGLHEASSRPHTRLAVQTVKPCATQSLQRPPADPHARVSLPVRHVPVSSQHPVGHDDGLHGRGVTVPPSVSVSGSRLERPHAKTTSTATKTKSDATIRDASEVEEEDKRMARTYRDRSVAEREPSR
jgi:hypothetical protein